MTRFPKKLFYKIGEVCRMQGIEPHVLRYWEAEFPMLSPPRNKSGQRIYRPKDLALIATIRRLLHEERYSIPGAVKYLREHGVGGAELPLFRERPTAEGSYGLREIRRDLESILQILAKEPDRRQKQAPCPHGNNR